MKSPDIRMDGALDRMVARLVESGPAIRREMETSAAAIEKSAAARWPVSKNAKKKHSRDAIESGAARTDDSVVTFVKLDVPYAFYIKTQQNGLNGKSPWQELIRKPGIAEGKRLATALVEELADIAGGGRG